MQDNMFRKGLVVGIIVLFIGASIVPSIASNNKDAKKIDYILNENETLNMKNDDCNNQIKQLSESGVISNNGWPEVDKLLASEGLWGDVFGYSVSIDNDYAIVGAWGDKWPFFPGRGAAYVFTRSGTDWIEQAKLLASDGAEGDFFGCSVSISGDYAIAGAWGDADNGGDSGSAYIFTRSGSTWIQQAKLLASDGTADDEFGYSVSIDGDYAFVGAPWDDDNGVDSGSAYIFTRSGSNWTQQAKLLASDGANYDRFAGSVSIDGDYIIVGAWYDADNGVDSGSAYVFNRSGSTWIQQVKLLASDGAAWDEFGYSVSIDNDYAIVGAWGDADNGIISGSAYVFNRSGTAWSEQAKLLASDGANYDRFGWSVSISGDYAIVGASKDDNGVDSGSAYIFKRSGTNWTQQAKLLASDGAADDEFGYSVSIDGDYAFVGAPWDDDNGVDSGSAYMFHKSGGNQPPDAPSNPSPSDGATGVDIDADLSWNCSDPDGDSLTYDVYFEANDSTPDVLVSDDQIETFYDPGTLEYETTYYWQIIATDEYGATTDGPIWNFTTEETPEPDLDCEGSLSWTGVKPGSTVTGSFTVKNIGDPGSELDWEIIEWPEWGDWSFDPDSGTGLPDGSSETVDVEVVAPDDPNTEFTGEVKVINSDDPSDYCTIPVYLKTPVNQPSTNRQILKTILQQFLSFKQIN